MASACPVAMSPSKSVLPDTKLKSKDLHPHSPKRTALGKLQRSFEFEKHPKPKGTCPQCDKPKVFRYYQDLTGNRLDEQYGKCERINQCGYQALPTGNKVPQTNSNYLPPPLPIQIFPSPIECTKFNIYLEDQSSAFHLHCFSLGVSPEHLRKWHVGSYKQSRQTVYIFIDGQNRIVNAKWFTYLADGKRNKDFESFSLKQPVNYGNAAKGLPEHRYMLCLFGEHLLSADKSKVVMVVESEKTAVIASFFYSQYDWIAVGSANGLTDAKIGPLFGRRIAWLCDADGNQCVKDKRGNESLSKGGRNNSSIKKLQAYQQKFCLIDLFPDLYDGTDLADAISKQIFPDLDKQLLVVTERDKGNGSYNTTTVVSNLQPKLSKEFIEVGQLTEEEINASAISEESDYWEEAKEKITFKKDKHQKPAKEKKQAYNDLDALGIIDEPSVVYSMSRKSILIKGQKVWNVVARHFFIFIKYMTKDENQNQMWIIEIQPANERPPVFLDVPHEDFFSAPKLKRLIGAEKYILQLNDTELGKLQEYLFTKTEFMTAIKVIRFGYHAESGVFFFANAAVKDGKILKANEFNIIELEGHVLCMPTIPKTGRHPFTLTESSLNFNQWFTIYQQAHLYENAFIPACFYLMSLFRDLVIDYKHFSPILFLKGSAGTGKSSIVRNLTCLFGFKAKDINLKSKNTAAALVKLMSQSSNTLTWMDEFFNGFEHEGLLQAAYDNAGYHLSAGVGTTETAEINIKSALALTSNYIPENEIFFSRCLFIPVNLDTKTEAQRAAYKKLQAFEEGGLGAITLDMLQHRQLIEVELDSGYSAIYTGLTKKLDSDVPERLKQNMAQVMAVAYILNKAGVIVMTEFSDETDILDDFVRIGIESIGRQYDLANEKSPLSQFFQILQQLYDEKKIIPDLHFRILNGGLLALHPSIFAIYLQKYRQVFFKDGWPKHVIEEEIRQLMDQSEDQKVTKSVEYPKGERKRSASRHVRDSLVVNYSLLKERFSVDLEHQLMQ